MNCTVLQLEGQLIIESSRSHLFVDIKFKVGNKSKEIGNGYMAGSEDVRRLFQNDYFVSQKKDFFDADTFEENFKGIQKMFEDVSGYSSMQKFNSETFNGYLGSLDTLLKPSNEMDNYIIPIKWQELFFGKHSVSSNQSWEENSVDWKNHQNFVNEYNNNQYTTKFKILTDFIDSLKILSDSNSGMGFMLNPPTYTSTKTKLPKKQQHTETKGTRNI